MLSDDPPPRTTHSILKTQSANVRASCYGWCSDEHREKLLERLVGITGAIGFDGKVNLVEHEIVYGPAVEVPPGTRRKDIVLRLRSDVLSNNNQFISFHKRNWHLSHQGAPEPRPNDKEIIVQRVVNESVVAGDQFGWLEGLGYKLLHEFTRQGYRFSYGKVVLSVSRMYELTEKHKVSTSRLLPQHRDIWLVEIVSLPQTQDRVDGVWDDLHGVVACLEGLVKMVPVEEGVLENRVIVNVNE
ncbi:Mediator of RNA polymerase II transcription subunit 18 [Rhizophlyctis rosea]|uniref:Mediator of RNA polymerase II transcription subunit 18 n=1 Tax=Rhizophlyctis rosea TaxID=64517 RepID=A0AAD5X165_9FUNG|nr:Mediator of RNA polymerase II transcription subunit 18 [Rhizophlyctis rosea]